MSDRWQLGNYQFVINPNSNNEQMTVVTDNVITLGGNIISQPTVLKEEYTLSSIFFQGMPKVTSTVSISHASGVEMLSGNYYVLNSTTKNVDVYNTNYSLLKSIALVSPSNGENFTSFDVQSNETIYAVEDAVSSQILHTVTSTTKTLKTIIGLNGNVQGIKYDNGNLWLVTSTSMLYKTDTSFRVLASMNLPYISSNNLGYKGMTMVNGYLVISFNSSDMTGAYHIDTSTGNIVNAFSLPTYTQITDVVFNGNSFVFTTNTNQFVYTNGNTLLVDIYTLEKQIKSNGFLSLIDDMGVNRRVTVSQYSIERQSTALQMYNVSITAVKVDRGII